MDRYLASVVIAVAIAAAIAVGFTVGQLSKTRTVTVTAAASPTTIYSTVYTTTTQTIVLENATTVTVTRIVAASPTETPLPTVNATGWDLVLALAQAYQASPPKAFTTTVGTFIPLVERATVTLQIGSLESTTAVPAAVPSVTVGGTEVYYSGTNVQVAGVDEQDIVKTNGTHIAVARWETLEVYRAYPPSKLALVADVDVKSLVDSLAGKEYLALISGNKTTVISEVKRSVSIAGLYYANNTIILVVNEYRWPGPLEPRTWIIELDPQLRPSRYTVVTGSVYDSRLAHGVLVLVTSSGPVKPIIILGGAETRTIVPPPIVVGAPTTETIVTALDVRSWRAGSIALVGAPPSTLYVTASGDIYLAVRGYAKIARILGEAQSNLTKAAEELRRLPLIWSELNTTIVRIELAEGPELRVAGNATVPGRVWKQWMVDVYNGVLRVVTENWEKGRLIVSLYTFNATTLEPLGKLEEIAVNERVHAVRFLGPRLYIVTFRNIDPLFTIDISDPRKPRVLGYLKGPGFDEYMHPLNETLLLGVGREDGKVRVTLYRVNSDGSIDVLSRVYVEGYSWSPVLGYRGHRAFTFNPLRMEAYIPVSGWRTGLGPVSGVAVVSVSVDQGRLELRGVLEHRGVVRQLFVDDVLYTIAPGNPVSRVKAYNLTTLRLIGEAPKPVKLSVAEIKANPEKYVDTAVILEGRAVEPPPELGQPPVSKSDWALDDGTGVIYVATYSPYLYKAVIPKPGDKVVVIGVVRVSWTGQPFISPYNVTVLHR